MHPAWQYDELRQVGVNFENAAQVAAYDAKQGSDPEAERALIASWRFRRAPSSSIWVVAQRPLRGQPPGMVQWSTRSTSRRRCSTTLATRREPKVWRGSSFTAPAF